jgi:NifU-like protein
MRHISLWLQDLRIHSWATSSMGMGFAQQSLGHRELTMDLQTTAEKDAVTHSVDGGERLKLIADTIEAVRPRLQRDGGDIELVEVDGLFVRVRLTGACVSCTMAGQTLGGVRRELMAALNEPVRVVPAPLD